MRQQLRVHHLRGPHGGEGEEHGADGGGDGATPKAAREEQICGREIQRPYRQHPELKRSVRRESEQSPQPVEGSDPEEDIGVGGGIRNRIKNGRTPEVFVSRHSEEPAIAVLEDVIVEPGIAPDALHLAQPRQQHRIELEQHTDCPRRNCSYDSGRFPLPALRANSSFHVPSVRCDRWRWPNWS